MKRIYSPSTGCTYIAGLHTTIPADAIELDEETYQAVIADPVPGKIRGHDANGVPVLLDPSPTAITADQLCAQLDQAADNARRAVAGDPLRAVEYERAAAEAQAFADAGFPTDAVPRTVSAWAIGGRTAQQAAENILAESAAYTEALYQIREARLSAKEQVRQAMAACNTDLAQDITDETIAAIEATIAGVGNATA